MADSRSLEVHKSLRESQQKLDYFLLGVSSALFAYLGGKFEPAPIQYSENSFEFAALILLFLSVLLAFIRLERNIVVTQLNFLQLDFQEKKGAIVQALAMPGPVLNTENGEQLDKGNAQLLVHSIDKKLPEILNKIDTQSKLSAVSARLRNWLLLLGFATLAFAKFVGVQLATKGI